MIGEAYISVQHHYDVSDAEARKSLIEVLTSGLVRPLNGWAVLSLIEYVGGPGLFDRLIADGYAQAGCETLTLDRKMSNLPGSRIL